MATFRYRAATPAGALKAGELEAASLSEVMDSLRRSGLALIEATEVAAARPRRAARIAPSAVASLLGELAVMLKAGIVMERALGVLAGARQKPAERTLLLDLRTRVKEGAPLSRAMAEAGRSFPAIAPAMTAAGEANGRPAEALKRLSETLERSEALRATIRSAMIYPSMLMLIAAGVIALMLYWVVPQFETLFDDASAPLPPITQAVLTASRIARSQGALWLVGLVAAAFASARLLARPKTRAWLDREVLKAPMLGPLVTMAETARFTRVLASLVESGVALPDALAIARGSIANTHMAAAVDRVTEGLRRGGGLSEPLEETGVFPPIAISYLKTGEESAQLGLMLDRLADSLDREVKIRLERAIAVATPLITVVLGAIVATVIASIMSAILGFDNLALDK